MLRKSVNYTDFDGNNRTEVLYFNISKPELLDYLADKGDNFESYVRKLTETSNLKGIMDLFKEIVVISYGEKSEDGRRFIKSEQMSKEFMQTEAYNTLFEELIADPKNAIAFIKGVIPADLSDKLPDDIEQKVIDDVLND